jgi:hypothetical protein
VIIEGKDIAGSLEVNGSLWLADCTIKNANIKVDGDVCVERPCQFHHHNSIEATGDIVFRNETAIHGPIICSFLACYEPFSNAASVKAKKILIVGESRFATVEATVMTFYGSCFADRIMANQIHIDGDLIANYVFADSVIVKRGSLLVKDLCVKRAEADIIGNYSDEPLDTTRMHFTWARPMREGAEPRSAAIDDMVRNGLTVLKYHTEHIPEIRQLYPRIQEISKCGDFTPLYSDLYNALKSNYDSLKPAMKQFVDCVEKHGFPSMLWRF